MANIAITSVGAKVLYCWASSSSASRPTTGYTQLPDVNEAPAIEMTPETIDVSNITDKVTRYAEGRQDPGSDMAFVLNHTDEVITAWEALVAQVATKKASKIKLWWEYRFEGAEKSYFWAGYPMALGTSGIAQNENDTIPAHCVLSDWEGWQTASTNPTSD